MSATKPIDEAELTAIKATLEQMNAEIRSLKAEYALADNDRGEGAMSEEELDAVGDRFDRLHDEHLIWSWLTTSSLLHGRLSGSEHDLMTILKSQFFSISARWLPVDAFAEAWRLMEDADAEMDLSYLDDSET
jgi:septation ring formation regulator EzrA